MIVKTQALVLYGRDWGENDRILTLLTRDYGKMTVYARGAKKLTSHFMSSAQQFCYGGYTLKTGGKLNYLTEAEISESFSGMRRSVEAMALGAYITEVAQDISVEEQPDAELLSLALNTLYLIAGGKKPLELIKAVYELRVACAAGFQPDCSECRECGKQTADYWYLDVMNGNIICSECFAENSAKVQDAPAVMPDGTAVILCGLDTAALAAVRHIVFGAAEKAFSFTLEPPSAKLFSAAAEKYLTNQLEKNFRTLQFYKSVADT